MKSVIDAINKIIEKIENIRISFWQIVLLFFSAAFIRTFCESFVNTYTHGSLTSLIDAFFHYQFGFVGVGMLIIIISHLLTGEDIKKISKVVAVFAFVIIIPPLIDFLVYCGRQVEYSFYVFGSYKELYRHFFSFFVSSNAASVGLKVENTMIILFSAIYIYCKSKKIFRSVLGAFSVYLVILSFALLLVLTFSAYQWFHNPTPVNPSTIQHFFYHEEIENSLTSFRTFISAQSPLHDPKVQEIINIYATTLSIILLVVDLVLLAIIYLFHAPKKLLSIFKNFRLARVVHGFLLITGGIVLGLMLNDGRSWAGSLFDYLSYLSLFLAFLFGWLFTVWENDEVDRAIDVISNPDRPLAKKEFSASEWKTIKWFFLLVSLSFGFLAGYYALTFVILFIILYHLYSTPPLRLKRVLFLSSLIVGLNGLIMVLSGYFMSSGSINLRSFPAKYSLGILAIYVLTENVKNLKDIKGDRHEGIKTLPVVLGERNAKLVVGGLVFVATLSSPFLFVLNDFTFYTALIFGTALFILINRKRFKERPVFLVYLAYLAIFIFEIIKFA